MYKVESYAGWLIVDTRTKREAHKEGVKEFGQGNVKSVEKATDSDIEYFIKLKGEDAIRPSNY